MGRHSIHRITTTFRHRARALIAMLSSLALVLGMAIAGGLGAGTAAADPAPADYTKGVAITMVSADGKTTDVGGQDIPVVTSGGSVKVTVWYYVRGNSGNNLIDSSMAGQNIVLTFAGISGSITGSLDFAGNTAFDTTGSGIDPSAKTVTLKVKDDLSAANDTGRFNIELELTNTSTSETITPSWALGGESGGTIHLISLKTGDEPLPSANSISKTSGKTNYDNVDVSNGFVSIQGSTEFIYTLTMFTKDGITSLDGQVINDVLSSRYLDYKQDYLSADVTVTLTTWVDGVPASRNIAVDANLVTFDTNAACMAVDMSEACSTMRFDLSKIPAEGSGYISQIPANSKLTISYKVIIKSGAEGDLLTDLKSDGKTLQDLYDDIVDGTTESTTFRVPLKNTATFPITVNSTNTAQRTVYLRGSVEPGKAFGKSSSWSTHYVPVGDFGAMSKTGLPIDVTYTFKVKLVDWAGTNLPDLSQDVIITDTLPGGMSWDVDVSDGAGITVENASSSGFALKSSGTSDCSANLANEGDFCVQDQTLKINAGQGGTTDVVISVKAKFNAYPNAPGSTTVTSDGAMAKKATNTAGFTFAAGKTYNSSVIVNLVDRGTSPGGEGIKDEKVFDKKATNASDGRVTFEPGKPATVKYSFTIHPKPSGVGNLEDINPGGLVVADRLSGEGATLFDLENPTNIKTSVMYGGAEVPVSSYSTVGDNATHTLTITFDDEWAPEGTAGSPAIANALTADVVVTLELTSQPIVGQQAIGLGDTAWFKSKGPDMYYWDEVQDGKITSWGDEVSTLKTVSDGNGFGASLRAEVDSTGDLLSPDRIYVYQIEVIPHGGYGDGTAGLQKLTDEWPDEMTFCGILSDSGASALPPASYPTSCVPGDTSVEVRTPDSSNKVKATYSSTGGGSVIDIQQSTGKFTWDEEKPLYIYVAAKINASIFTINKPALRNRGCSPVSRV